MSDYPGNAALPDEVKQRVLSTFRQTLDLYDQGLLDDVVVGCEFILKMDPVFDPAKKLLEKARNPAAKIDLAALAALTGAGRAPDVPDEPDPASVIAQAREAMTGRDWSRAADLAAGVLRRDMMNVEAQQIAEEARERIEADPFIQQFASKARQQLERGDSAGARATITKARSLDADHPLVADVEAEVGAAGPAFDPVSAFGDVEASAAKPDEPATFDFSTSDSFVVDGASGAGSSSSGAPASDFGFTFEEEQGEGPEITIGKTSPGIPSSVREAAEASSSDTFDFSTASVDISTDDQKKIDGYLTQGDDAYAAEDFQKAIDIWSRIFLIDVTNDQASERIEKARSKKIEIDRKVDELASAATIAAEKKDLAKARGLYEKILTIDPGNTSATEQLEALGTGAPPEVASIPFAAGAPASAPARPEPHPFDDDFFLDQPGGEPREEIPAPADDDSLLEDDDEVTPRKATRARPATAPPPKSRAMLFAVVGLVVLLGLGFGVWKVFLSGDEPDVNASSNALTTAERLADAGQLDQAIATLLAVPAGNPDHEEALARVAELRALKAQNSGMIDGRPATEVFQELIERANVAFAANDYVAAKAALEQASAIQPLPPDARELYDLVNVHAAQFENARNLFSSGDYPAAIAASETILSQNPENANALDLIARARFNMGVQALQEERLADAIGQFDALLQTNPDDELAKRARELALRYDGTNKDLLYRIFVKYLPTR